MAILFDEAGTQGDPGAGAAAGADAAAKAAADKAASDKAAADKAASDKAAADKAASDKAAADKAAAGKGAPEKYEFTAPEGHQLDAEITTEFSGVAKKLNLTQEQASEIYAIGGKLAQKQAKAYTDFIDKTRTQWVADVKADPELGGAAVQENLGIAKKAIAAFDRNGELVKYLNESGAGDNPALIRAFFRIGKAISNDKLVVSDKGGSAAAAAGQTGSGTPVFSYPNSKHNG